MRRNKVRELLNAGKPTLGTHLHSTWPSVVEMVGHTGIYDYVEFVGEYAPYDLYALDNFCRAVELFDMGAMIKIDQEPRRFIAQRAIGAGFQSVLFADTRSTAEVQGCIEAVRPETPSGGGNHGVGSRRATYLLDAGTPAYEKALKEIVIALMIEKKGAVDELEQILALPGVDMVQWGPADYAFSIGKPGGWYDPEVRLVEKKVIAACLKAGVRPRAEINTAEDARFYIDMGVRDFCVGTDIYVLHEWLSEHGDAVRKVVEGS